MRKLIVLIMTSVLATGAVANADDVNVVEDPGNVIRILQAVEGTEANIRVPLPASNAATLTPGLESGRDKYTFRGEALETLDTANLEKVAVCFFDTRVADDSTKVDNLCGYGSAGGTLATTKADVGTDNPESALQASFEKSDLATFNNDNTNLHTTGTGGDSVASVETTFKGLAATNAVHFGVTVQLSHAMAAGSGAYKIRVVAIYDDNSVFSLTDTSTYSVDTYHSIGTDREAVNFEDMNPGDQILKSGINAGEYYANTTANFSISATEFEISGVADSSVPFSTDNPGFDPYTAGNKFWLACSDNDSSSLAANKYVTTSGQSFYSDQPGSNTQADPEAPKTLSDSMRCQLSVGDDVPFGEYTNTVDMGIS